MNNSASHLHRAAVSALNSGDYKTLHQLSLKMVSTDRENADGWFFLSIVASAQRSVVKAIEMIDRALAIAPRNSEYLSQKAKCHCVLRQDKQAFATAEKARSLEPESAIVLDTLGVIYTNLGHYDKACELLRAAVLKQPQNAQYQFNLAAVEQFLGDFDAAKSHYNQAIKIRPFFPRVYWSLSELEKSSAEPRRIEKLEAFIAREKISSEDRLYIAHALYREYEKAGKYREALSILAGAKAAHAAKLNYSVDHDVRIFDAVERCFSRTRQTDNVSPLGSGAIFIVGMPRTGTTLVERILSSHSEIVSLGELQNLSIAIRQSVSSRSRRALDPEIVEKAISVDFSVVGKKYLDSILNKNHECRFFIDKMPLNFLYIGFIRMCLPNAKIICLRRNPLDTCLSNYRQLFAMNASYYNYSLNLQDTATYYGCFDRLMRRWKNDFSQNLLEIQYETLVSQPKESIERLLEFVGLPWEQSCLEFHRNSSAVATPSGTQVREKLYDNAVNRWKNYKEELAPIKRYLEKVGAMQDIEALD